MKKPLGQAAFLGAMQRLVAAGSVASGLLRWLRGRFFGLCFGLGLGFCLGAFFHMLDLRRFGLRCGLGGNRGGDQGTCSEGG